MSIVCFETEMKYVGGVSTINLFFGSIWVIIILIHFQSLRDHLVKGWFEKEHKAGCSGGSNNRCQGITGKTGFPWQLLSRFLVALSVRVRKWRGPCTVCYQMEWIQKLHYLVTWCSSGAGSQSAVSQGNPMFHSISGHRLPGKMCIPCCVAHLFPVLEWPWKRTNAVSWWDIIITNDRQVLIINLSSVRGGILLRWYVQIVPCLWMFGKPVEKHKYTDSPHHPPK
jgi:hypothetical protein